MQTNSYKIPTSKIDDFEHKFAKIQRKAEKFGGLVGYRLGDIEQITWGEDGIQEVQEVTVWGEAPIIEGWEVIAVIDHTSRLVGSPFNLVHNLGADSAAERFKTLENDCDHCGWNRKRKTTVVIRHVESREQKHVGIGCLADFTGSHDPHHAARLCQYVTEALSWGGFGSDAEPLLNKREFLAQVAAAIQIHGWVSKGNSSAFNPPTIQRVWDAYQAERNAKIEIEYYAEGKPYANPERVREAQETLARHQARRDEQADRVESALEWLEFEANTSDEFIAKLHAALAGGEGLVRKHAGIAAALFTAYDRAAKSAVKGHSATEGQERFIRSLCAERGLDADEVLNGLDKRTASAKIDELKSLPIKVSTEVEENTLHLLDGSFVKVQRSRGGRLYTKTAHLQFHGDDDVRVDWEYTGRTLLPHLSEQTVIDADTAAAFGHLTSRCVYCSSKLETPESVTVGYGPTCASNHGLPWGAVDESVKHSREELANKLRERLQKAA